MDDIVCLDVLLYPIVRQPVDYAKWLPVWAEEVHQSQPSAKRGENNIQPNCF